MISFLSLKEEGLLDFFKKKEDPSMLCSIKIPTKFLDNIDNASYDDDETELSVWEVFKRITLPEDWDDRWVGILYGRSFEPYWVIEEATPSGSGSDINDRIKWLWSELNSEIRDINKLSKLIQQKKFVEVEPYIIKLDDLKHLDINKPEEVINIISKEDEVPGFLNRIKELKEDYPENKQEIDKVVSELFKMFNVVKKSRLELLKTLKPYLIDPKNLKKEELNMSEELQLRTEDLEIATEGLKTDIKAFFASIFHMGDEKVVIDFEVPGLKFTKYAGINSHDGTFEIERDNPTQTLKGVIDDFWLAFTNIEISAKEAGGFIDLPFFLKMVKTSGDMIDDFLKCLDTKATPRVFRVPKEAFEGLEKGDLPSRVSKWKKLFYKNWRDRKPTFLDKLLRVMEPQDAKMVNNYLERNINRLDEVILKLVKKCDEARKKKLSLEEAQVEVQTNETVEDASNVIVLDVPGYLEKVKTSLPVLVNSIGWLQEYKQDPYKAVGKFTEEGHVLCEQFKDIKDGLVGAFSSEKATLLGAKKLLTFIESTADSVKNDYTELSNRLANWVAKDLSANLNSIIETTDPGMLEKRKLMYRQNNVTLKYGNFKLEKCIQPYIQEISSSMDMVEYLKRIKELQHSLKLDLKPLEETIRKYKYNNTYIANNNVYIGKSQFMDNKVEKDPELPKTANHLEAYKTFLAQVDVSQDTDTVAADILDNIIDNFNGTLQGLKRSVEDFLKLLNSIGENNSKFNDSIDVLISQYVLPYGDNTCLKDDFIVGYNQCMLAISNSLNNDENLISHISYVGSQLECLLNNYSYLYSFLEKLTVEMTITEKSSVSE